MVIDELAISDEDIKRMKADETSEMEEILTWLRRNTAMTLAALSSTSLLDRQIRNDGTNISRTKLEKMMTRTEYEAVNLKHIMRSSSKIAVAASPESVKEMVTTVKTLQETIEPGSSSTVPGRRPRALVYKHTDNVDYDKLADFVRKLLSKMTSANIKIAVLCDLSISARKLSDKVKNEVLMPVSCYDGGVEMFEKDGSPMYRENTADDRGDTELTEWLEDKCNILLTHTQQFRGCESDAVILVTHTWYMFTKVQARRSGITRGVASMVLFISDSGLKIREMRKHWDVEILEEGASGIEITEEKLEKLEQEWELLFSQPSPGESAQERLSQVEQEIIGTKKLLRELNLKTVSHFNVEFKEIVLSSTEGSAQTKGGSLGQYSYDPDKGCYVQTNTQKGYENYKLRYLYFVDDGWWVGSTPGVKSGTLNNPTSSQSLPLVGWKYFDGKSWITDSTLVISPGPLSTLCYILTVSTSGPAAEKQPHCWGKFSRTEMWWNGRPVFRNSQGQLMHQSPHEGWYVGPALGGYELGTAILLGSMAHQCPASEEKWTYWDGSKYRPASIKIKCNVHTSKCMCMCKCM